MENAINPRARSHKTENELTTSVLAKPNPLIPSFPRQKGPKIIPVTKYAVTAGKPISLANRVNARPKSKATDKLSKITVELIKNTFRYTRNLKCNIP